MAGIPGHARQWCAAVGDRRDHIARLRRLCVGRRPGLIAGAGLALNGGARRLFSPTFNGAQPIALFAWIPLLSAWLGTGEIMKLALIALGAFFPMLLSAQAGCGGVPQSYLEVGRLLELAPSTRLFRIVLPAARTGARVRTGSGVCHRLAGYGGHRIPGRQRLCKRPG